MAPLKEVKSSLIHSMGYDAASKTLAIRFQNSALVYHYADVPAETADALIKAESIGKVFGSLVRGKYRHTTVGEDDEPAPKPAANDEQPLPLADGSVINPGAAWPFPETQTR